MPPKVDSSYIDSCVSKILTSTEVLESLASKLVGHLKKAVEDAVTAALDKALTQINDLAAEVSELRLRVDDMEQYERRTNVRVFGLPEREGEDTDHLVLSLCKDRLKVDMSVEKIDRSHRVGRKQEPGPDGKVRPRPIIVRFVSYRDRRTVFNAKKLLKDTGVTIREDLTATRLQLFKTAAEKYGQRNTWTMDGRVKWITGTGTGQTKTFHTTTRLADLK